MVTRYHQLDLATSQLELSIDISHGMSCFMTPYADFSRLPNPLPKEAGLLDLIPIDLGDLFVALCTSPTPFSNILHLRGDIQSKIHYIIMQGKY